MFNMYFLSASKPLTKTFTLDAAGNLLKSPYPTVAKFTSHEEKITSLKDMYNAVVKHSKLNHCALKGIIKDSLNEESRAAATRTDDFTNWGLIDLDSHPVSSVEEFMQMHAPLRNLSYIVQYSSSYGISASNTLSAHIFILLDKPVRANIIKPWLLSLNMNDSKTRSAITLSRTGTTLHYPVDLTTCQNDKLIYIAPPILGKGIKSTITPAERIQYVAKKQQSLDTSVFATIAAAALDKDKRTLLNTLREAKGLPKYNERTKWVGEFQVVSKPGVISQYEVREDGDWMRFNFNGGDSWAYYHPINNYKLIHSFKDSTEVYDTKEILPDYYKECLAAEKQRSASPIVGETLVLGFRDLRTSNYWNGTWIPAEQKLTLAPARDVTQVDHFLRSYGISLIDGVVPIWEKRFAPQENYVIDEENHLINEFVLPPMLRAEHKKLDYRTKCPVIYRVLKSAISGNEDNEVLEEFLNWLATIMQKRIKTCVAWVLSGTEGTGKGLIFEQIIRAIMNNNYVVSKKASELAEDFTGWLETSIFAYIDEVQISSTKQADLIAAKLRNHITEPMQTIRNMRQQGYNAPNYTNFIFSSNKHDPVLIEENDRRYNFGTFQTEKLKITRSEVFESIPAELEAFVSYLMTRAIDVDRACTVFNNPTRQKVIESSRTSLDELGIALLNGDIELLWNNMPDLNLISELHGASTHSSFATAYHTLVKRELMLLHSQGESESTKPPVRKTSSTVPEGLVTKAKAYVSKPTKIPKDHVAVSSKLTRDELHMIFEYCIGNMPTTPNKFTILLRHRKIDIVPIKVNSITTRGMHITWHMNKDLLDMLVTQLEVPKAANVTNIKKAKVA